MFMSPGFVAGFAAGFALGLSVSLVTALVLRSRINKITVESKSAVRMYRARIEGLKEELEKAKSKGFREQNLCKTAPKLPAKLERDPAWKIDIPPCVLN